MKILSLFILAWIMIADILIIGAFVGLYMAHTDWVSVVVALNIFGAYTINVLED